jgi:hypothetical protein
MLLKVLKSRDWQGVVDYIGKIKDNGREYLVEIKVRRKRRTIDQNSLYWLWLTCIMDETGMHKDDLHEFFKQKYLGIETHTIRLYNTEYSMKMTKSTTVLNTKEMKYYLDRVQQFANAELGIALPNPEYMYWEEFYNHYKNYI